MSQGDAEFSYTASPGSGIDVQPWKREFDQDNTNFVITFNPANVQDVQTLVQGLFTNATFTGPNMDIGFARLTIDPSQQNQDPMNKMASASSITAKIPAVIERMAAPGTGMIRYFLPRRLLLRIRSNYLADPKKILSQYNLWETAKEYASPGLFSVTFPLAQTQGQSELSMLFNAIGTYKKPEFESVEPHQVDFNAALLNPNDPLYPQQWALKAPGHTGTPADRDVRAPEAWNLTTGNHAVIVAVLDTGIDSNHPDLVGNVVDQFNAITGASTPITVVEDNDPNGHGTKVCGVIGARTNTTPVLQIAGMSWNCGLFPVKVDEDLITLDYAKVTAGIDRVRTRAQANVQTKRYVLNLSLKFDAYYSTVFTAIQNAYNAGVVIVAAAADDARDIATPPVTYPAVWTNQVIPVGGHKNATNCPKVSTSNWNSLAVIAPGDAILTTIRGGGPPQNVTGTSLAAGLVSGIAALCLARHYTMHGNTFADSATTLRIKVYNCIKSTRAWSVDPLTPFKGRIDAFAAVSAMT